MARRLLFTVGLLVVMATVHADVVSRVIARNPSSEQTQQFVVRSYLPKGIAPEDILDNAGMEIVYDEQKELYLARQTLELEPGQTAEFEIRLRDIWQIDVESLEELKRRATDVVSKLEGEVYATHAKVLLARILTTVDLITTRQEASQVPDVSIPDHISAYDRNQNLFELVRADVMELENLLAITSDEIILASGKPKGVPPSLTTIWKVIFAIVTFIALMSVIFFVIWTVQVRKIRAAEKLQGLE